MARCLSGVVPGFRGLLCLLVLLTATARADEDPLQQHLRTRIETLELKRSVRVDGVELSATQFIPSLYRATQFKPVWSDAKKVDQLLRAIAALELDGLDPKDYYLEKLQALRTRVQESKDPLLGLDLDLLLSDAFARVIYHAHYGKVDPQRLDDTWNLDEEYKGKRGPQAVLDAINGPSLYDAIESLKPQRPVYHKLRDALAKYRAIQAAGGWGTIAAGSNIELGKSDPRVPAIRHRLALTGDLPKDADNKLETYDDPLLRAVESFQKRHDLPIRSKIDGGLLRTMSLPPKVWIDVLRVNLERARWILRVDDPTYVLVNIAAFHMYYVKAGKRVWEKDVQVGRTFSQTPLFREEIKYFVLNPMWTVPPGVLAETVLPSAKKSARYIRDRGLHVFDDTGHEVAPESVNWHKFEASNLPYTITQDPGKENALGAIKFMFPNPYHVYLHDTPNQLGYDARVRTMSWGCIHVKDPLELAALVVEGTQWTLPTIQAQVKSGKSATVYLPKPVPVYLLYWTAEVDRDDNLVFHSDVYNRDRKVLSELNKPPRKRRDVRRSIDQSSVGPAPSKPGLPAPVAAGAGAKGK
jgi:L,D-transpeptidase YcbB